MKRLLVTGASGFMGSRVADCYRGKYEIYAPARRELDITEEESVIARLREWRPDAVVHCAAISDIRRCEEAPEQSWDINVEGSVNLARASALIGAKCLLCSSDQVYFGSALSGPHREQEELKPGNLYGREKLCAEEKCLKVNPDCVQLRLSWMYDARTVNKGEHSDFLRTLLARIQTGEKLSYPADDVRGITDVNEVVRNLEAAFHLEGGIYNFGSPNEKSTYETVCAVFRQLRRESGYTLWKEEEAYAMIPRDISMSQEKLNSCGIFFRTTQEGILDNLKNLQL